MSAEVRHCRQLAVLIPPQQDWLVADDDRKLIAWSANMILGGDEHPISVPDAVPLGLEERRIPIGDVGQGAVGGERQCGGTHKGQCSGQRSMMNLGGQYMMVRVRWWGQKVAW